MPADQNKKYLPKRPKAEAEVRRILRSNIRNRRVAVGLKQRELGELCQVTQSYIQQIESQKKEYWGIVPTLFLLADLAKALDTTTASLLTPGAFGSKIDPDTDMRHLRGKEISL